MITSATYMAIYWHWGEGVLGISQIHIFLPRTGNIACITQDHGRRTWRFPLFQSKVEFLTGPAREKSGVWCKVFLRGLVIHMKKQMYLLECIAWQEKDRLFRARGLGRSNRSHLPRAGSGFPSTLPSEIAALAPYNYILEAGCMLTCLQTCCDCMFTKDL